MAERTRRAYGIDAGPARPVVQLRSGLDPADVDPARAAALRRRCSPSAGRARRPTARKLAALRQLYRVLHEHGEVPANPADLVPAPKRAVEAAARPRARADLGAAGPHPGDDAAGAPRPRPVRARLRVRPARRGARRPRRRELVDFDDEEVRVEGKGRKTRLVPAGEAALRARRALARARPPGAAERRRRPGAVPLQDRPPAVDVGRPAPSAGHGRDRRRSRAGSRRTRCATRSRRTSWTAAPTCGRSRSCWATAPCARRRSTLG